MSRLIWERPLQNNLFFNPVITRSITLKQLNVFQNDGPVGFQRGPLSAFFCVIVRFIVPPEDVGQMSAGGGW